MQNISEREDLDGMGLIFGGKELGANASGTDDVSHGSGLSLQLINMVHKEG